MPEGPEVKVVTDGMNYFFQDRVLIDDERSTTSLLVDPVCSKSFVTINEGLTFPDAPKSLFWNANGDSVPVYGVTLGLKSIVSDALTLFLPILGISDVNLSSL